MRFENDGTGRRETYMRVKAQSEAGVEQWGQVVLGYNAATERLDIPFVRVKKADGTVVETPSQSVQDLSSPVQRVAPVYTDFRQKHVTVQSFRPGDTLEVSMVTTIHTPLAAGQFWTEYGFNDEAIVLDEQLDIDVPAARRLTLKLRPGFDPSIKEADGRRVYHWTHAHAVREQDSADKDKKPDTKPSDEPERAPIRLTTFTDWNEVGRWFAGLEQSARKPTPEIREKARELTAGRTTDLEKLEALYDFVSKNFRYVSLSLGVGRYQPRAASDVLREAYGDCKDKHTLLASLIDAAGMQASAALINSQVKLDPDFPSPTQFDHVITRAIVDGQPVWLDATPEVAPFRLLSANLRARQALVTDVRSGPRLEETPGDAPMRAVIATDVDGRIDDTGALSGNVRLTFRGDVELLMRMAFRATPAPQWKTVVDQIVKQSVAGGKLSDLKVADPQATKEPFTIAFHVDAPAFVDLSRKKFDLALPLSAMDAREAIPEPADSGPIKIGSPGELTYTLKLEVPAAVKVRLPVPVTVNRDYAAYWSQYESAGSTATLVRALTWKQRELPNERRGDVVAFRRVVNSDAEQQVAIDASAMSPATAAPEAEAKALNQSGYDALRAGDYARAVTLLKRVVELQPKDRTAWNNLGRAYVGLRETDSAIAAYRKQVEVNPYDEFAYNNLGLAYVAKGMQAEAEAAYAKQIEVNPLDKRAHGNLGRLYVEQRQFDKAAVSLEKAIALTPDEVQLHVQLGKAYLGLNKKEAAASSFARAVELAPTPGTWNDVAYELSLGGMDLERAQQYAESALASAAAASRNLDIENADARALAIVGSLGAYWDTLGWVYFAKGDLTNAERYVAASWQLTQHAEVGDHLGQIYEKTGRRTEAIRLYAAALSARQPAAVVREHLARVGGGAVRTDTLVAEHRGDLSVARTFTLPAKGPAGKKADFLVLIAAPGRVDAVKFVEGDEEMRALAPALQKIPFAGTFPDDSPSKIVRRGVAACRPSGDCSFTMLLPEDVRPVK